MIFLNVQNILFDSIMIAQVSYCFCFWPYCISYYLKISLISQKEIFLVLSLESKLFYEFFYKPIDSITIAFLKYI